MCKLKMYQLMDTFTKLRNNRNIHIITLTDEIYVYNSNNKSNNNSVDLYHYKYNPQSINSKLKNNIELFHRHQCSNDTAILTIDDFDDFYSLIKNHLMINRLLTILEKELLNANCQ